MEAERAVEHGDVTPAADLADLVAERRRRAHLIAWPDRRPTLFTETFQRLAFDA